VVAPLRLFDTHCHFDDDVFDQPNYSRLQHINAIAAAGVNTILLAGTSAQRWPHLLRVCNYVNQNSKVQCLASVGIHPWFTEQHSEQDLDTLNTLLSHHPITAIGEIGLDTFSTALSNQLAAQLHFFTAQLAIAQRWHKPIILHIRNAFGPTIAQLKASQFSHGGIAHAFSGGAQEAKQMVNLGFAIGISGSITQPNPRKLREVIQAVGLNNLVLESDSPSLTPLTAKPHPSGFSANTPANLPYVFAALCNLLAPSHAPEHIGATLYNNSLSALKLTAASPC
jgi:TatD DNase family protein